MHFFCVNIWSCQKKTVLLQSISAETCDSYDSHRKSNASIAQLVEH